MFGDDDAIKNYKPGDESDKKSDFYKTGNDMYKWLPNIPGFFSPFVSFGHALLRGSSAKNSTSSS